ncbi:D-alanyl-D-alanine carboxypeptidase PBP3 [Streptococcus gallolyticus]|nr:D-alanyl-D-alanine carboxypeptidase PBP3 [Streptococcus gallolyticus]MBY5041964.1 D-alanyl-D-alanine carboxypeptidase PBP3 [Streptococcus gallolyticus]
MKKFILWLNLVLLTFFPISQLVAADGFSVPAKHAIAVDFQSGKVLYEKDAATPTHIASISKLLTVYLVYEAMEQGKFGINTKVDISNYPYQLTIDAIASNIDLDTRQYTVQELLQASLISSANSAAIALAEKVAGSEPKFVDMMTAKLKEWGITDAKLVNATGLNNEILGNNIYPGSSSTDENTMSAKDIAIVARRLLLDYPEVTDITSKYSFTLEGNTYYSTNQMIEDGTYQRGGVTGLKTGTTELSGASFVATTAENHFQIITVILEADKGDEFPDNRFVATNALMDYVYNNFTLTTLVKKGESYADSTVKVFNGTNSISRAIASKDMTLITRKDKTDAISATFKADKEVVDAPIKAGHKLGSLTSRDTDLIGSGYLDQLPNVTMIAKNDTSTPTAPVSWWNHFVRYVNEKL